MRNVDLMVGDLVTFKDCQNDEKPVIIKVMELHGYDDLILASIDGDKAYDELELYDEIVGIPLTPEILEKNGFRKLETYGTEKWVRNNIILNIYDSGKTWRFYADTHRNEGTVIYIRFIHELQHCSQICGISLDIKL